MEKKITVMCVEAFIFGDDVYEPRNKAYPIFKGKQEDYKGELGCFYKGDKIITKFIQEEILLGKTNETS